MLSNVENLQPFEAMNYCLICAVWHTEPVQCGILEEDFADYYCESYFVGGVWRQGMLATTSGNDS